MGGAEAGEQPQHNEDCFWANPWPAITNGSLPPPLFPHPHQKTITQPSEREHAKLCINTRFLPSYELRASLDLLRAT